MTILDQITALAQDAKALQELQASVRKPLRELLKSLTDAASDFARGDSLKRAWISSSRFSPLLASGAIHDGSYNFGASSGDGFLLETEDSYGSWNQVAITLEEAADLSAVLEDEYSRS